MGEHKRNPIAHAAARGDISKADRQPIAKTGGGTLRSVLELKQDGKPLYRENRKGVIHRNLQKVRGKANVKQAKKARRIARERLEAAHV